MEPARRVHHGDSWSTILALVSADGSAAHGWARHLASEHAQTRDIADAIHTLCGLHGRNPGVIDFAAEHDPSSFAHAWLSEAASAFTIERGWLARIASVVGPMPSTPGQAESEATVTAQRHALDMLAQSDRTGTAVGAAVALVLDWTVIRAILDHAGSRFGVEREPSRLPHETETATVVSVATSGPAVDRAIAFGAQQMLAQHRGLWDLLEARAGARDEA